MALTSISPGISRETRPANVAQPVAEPYRYRARLERDSFEKLFESAQSPERDAQASADLPGSRVRKPDSTVGIPQSIRAESLEPATQRSAAQSKRSPVSADETGTSRGVSARGPGAEAPGSAVAVSSRLDARGGRADANVETNQGVSPGRVRVPAFSPSGDAVAQESVIATMDASGRVELYVRRVAGPSAPDERGDLWKWISPVRSLLARLGTLLGRVVVNGQDVVERR